MELRRGPTQDPPEEAAASDPIPGASDEADRAAPTSLLALYSVALALSMASIWIQGSYFIRDPFGLIVFVGGDGFVGADGAPLGADSAQLGVHVFGDLKLPYYWAREPNPWAGVPHANNYPPLAVFLFEPLTHLGYWNVIRIAIPVLVLSLASPIWWATRGSPLGVRWAASAMILTTGPALAIVDRGNIAGLLAIPTLVLALAWVRSRQNVLALCLAIVVGIKLYPVLICGQLLATRRIKAVILGGVLTVATAVSLWVWYDEPGIGELRQFRAAAVFFGGPEQGLPLQWNFSFPAGLSILASVLGWPVTWVTVTPWLPGAILIGIHCLILVTRPTLSAGAITIALALASLTTPVSYRYSQVFAVVGVALVILSARGYRGLPLVTGGPLRDTRRRLLLVALVITLAPLAWPIGAYSLSQILIPCSWAILVLVETTSWLLSMRRRESVMQVASEPQPILAV